VPDLDDEQFETYLREFRPLVPDAPPVRDLRPARNRRRPLILAAVALGVVASVILGVASFRLLNYRGSIDFNRTASVGGLVSRQPLTLRDVNGLLATAPSYKSAMDELVFPRHRSIVPDQSQSALAVLAKEKIKL